MNHTTENLVSCRIDLFTVIVIECVFSIPEDPVIIVKDTGIRV